METYAAEAAVEGSAEVVRGAGAGHRRQEQRR